jgi:anti-sigma regulatory factor (Ser/Thr protein kinase)
MERYFKKDMSSLGAIFSFLSENLDRLASDETTSYVVNLATEELFTNMVKYSKESNNDIAISVQGDGHRVIVSLSDTDVEPFDIRAVRQVDTGQQLEQRKVGGLGIHIVRQLVDDIQYEYVNRCSKVTFIKQLES